MKLTKQLLIQAILFFLILQTGKLAAQQSKNQNILEEGSVEEQFNYVLDKSSTYNDYKAIKSSNIYTLKKNVFDTLKLMRDDAANKQSTILANNTNIESLTEQLTTTQKDLALAIKEKNSLQFIGINMSKSLYNSIMWLLAGILAFFLVIFVMLYKRSNAVTVRALNDLEETRDEFEKHRKWALDRQEEVVRKYHAELVKYKSNAVSNKSSE
jgi:preprotein translocase subunit SecF